MVNADLDALAVELARLDVLIEAEMRRTRARYELSLDEFRGLYITNERVEALLRAQPTTEQGPVPSISDARASDTGSRWRQLADALELTDDERDLLLVCLAPELDARYETLYAYLNDDVTRRWPTPDLCLRLLAPGPERNLELRGCLLLSARLFATGVLERLSTQRDEPRQRRGLRVAPPVVEWLEGFPYVDERLVRVGRFGASEPRLSVESMPEPVRGTLASLTAHLARRATLPVVVIRGGTASEAETVAEDLFARAGRQVLVIDGDALRAASAPDEMFSAIALAQHVLQISVIVGSLEPRTDGGPAGADGFPSAMSRFTRRSPSVILAVGPGITDVDVFADAPSLNLTLSEPGAAERMASWRWALGEAGDGPTPSESTVIALADRFALGSDQVMEAAATARGMAMLEGAGRPTRAHVFAAARAASSAEAGGTTRVVTSAFDWDDLVLPSEAKARLVDVVHAVEQRPLVLDEWGFSRRLGGTRGLKVMFAGPSGTGKSMAAGIVAKTLQLDLHAIEIGSVVSKYIGETEKNLDRAFGAAMRANAILLIDEADALLGKRSQVKDAHDRYANVEVAYLLQKMEDYDGIVIVATNLSQNIDEAFSRRMHYTIEFPRPDVTAREGLWRGIFPSTAPVAPDVDFTYLARQFDLAGGDIRNVALDSAYRAAQDESAITLGHVLGAIARQFAKHGKVLTQADFREHYADLLSTLEGPRR